MSSRSRRKRRRWKGWKVNLRLARRRGKGRSVNLSFMLWLLLSFIVLSSGVVYVHGRQVSRNADIFKRQAEQAVENKRYAEAALYYARYLNYVPTDAKARAEWAQALENKTVRSKRDYEKAIELYEQVLRRDPNSPEEVRRRLIKLCMTLRRFNDAQEHIKFLLDNGNGENGELEQWSALCYAETKNFPKAKQYYGRAIKHDPKHIASYPQFAMILDDEGDRKKADEVMKELVQRNEQNYEAHLSFARFLRSRRNFDEARDLPEIGKEIERAYELGKDKPETLFEMIELARMRHEPEKVRKYLHEGIERYPGNFRMYVELSQLEQRHQRLDEAIAWVRRGLKAVPADSDIPLLRQLTVCLIAHGDDNEAKATLERLERSGVSQAVIKELSAYQLAANGQWREAASILENVLPHVEANPEELARVSLLLGNCYEKRGEIDRALKSYAEVLRVAPRSAAAHEGKGKMLLALGQREDALVEYRAALREDNPRMALKVAELLFWRNLRQRDMAPDWAELDKLLEQADKNLPDSTEVALLKARVRVARGIPGEAVQAVADLAKHCQKNPGKLEAWLARVDFADVTNLGDKALDILDEAEKRLGDRVELRLARAQHWEREARNAPQAQTALSKLEENTAHFSAEDEATLLRGLGEVYARAGKLLEAKRLWRRVADKMPRDLQVRLALFNLALRDNDTAALERLAEEVKELDSDGTHWRLTRANTIVHGMRTGGDKRRAGEARRLFVEIINRRDSFGPAYRGLAALDELEGNTQFALDHYQQALALGDRNPYTLRRYCQLLYNQQRVAEVERILKEADEQGNLPPDLRRAQASLFIRDGDYQSAIDLANQTVDKDSRDPLDLVWLGQVYAAAGSTHHKQAEQYFKKALALPGADKLEEPWVACVRFLVRIGRKKGAQEVIQEARTKLAADVQTLALARCHEAVGELDKAAAEFDAALKVNPSNLAVLRAVVDFYASHGQLRKSEPYLRKLLDPSTRAGESEMLLARRGLALLKVQGNYQEYQEAVAMLEENIRQGGGSPEDRRTLAVVLAGYPPNRLRAINMLESLQPPTPEQLRALARLCEAARDWPRARALYDRLASSSLSADEPKLAYAAESAMALLRHGEVGDANIWMRKLVELDPDSQATVDLQVHVLKEQNNPGEALKVLKRYQEKKDVNLALAGKLFEYIGELPPAEAAYRKWMSAATDPQRMLTLASFLGRHDRKDEALDLCERAARAGAIESAAGVAVEMLRPRQNLHERQCQRVEHLLIEAGKKNPASPLPVLELAELRDLQQRYAESEECYRRVLQMDDRNVMALNNLAWMLAVRGGNLVEARQLIDRAMTLAGELGHLLDTRAIILIKQEAVKEAQSDLGKALQEEETASRYFHLAQAQQQNRKTAIDSLRKARDLHLARSKIHPLEFKGYDQLLELMDEK